jgi:hypothetical protein
LIGRFETLTAAAKDLAGGLLGAPGINGIVT